MPSLAWDPDDAWYGWDRGAGTSYTVDVEINDPETGEHLGTVRTRRPRPRPPSLTQTTGGASRGVLRAWQLGAQTVTTSAATLTTGLSDLSTAAAGATVVTQTLSHTVSNIYVNTTSDWYVDTSRYLNTANWGYYGGSTIVRSSPEELRRAKRRAAVAKGRARRLLREHLTDAEHSQLEASGYFEVTSVTTGHVYRIYRGYSRNVVRLDEAGVPVERLCAHGPTSSRMPDEDHMLSQRLYLESCEAEFRKIANISRIGKVEAASLLAPTGAAIGGRRPPIERLVADVERTMLPLAA